MSKECETCGDEGRRTDKTGWPIDCPECGMGWPTGEFERQNIATAKRLDRELEQEAENE